VVARAGLDIAEPGFWSRGLALLEGLVAEAERTARDLTRAA
jgi:hypothetical protein